MTAPKGDCSINKTNLTRYKIRKEGIYDGASRSKCKASAFFD